MNKGTVISVDNFIANVKLDKPDTLVNKYPWVFLTELVYQEKLKIDVRNVNGSLKRVQEALKDFKLLEFTSACDVYLDTFGSTKTWALKYPNTGSVFADKISIDGAGEIENLKGLLKRFARYRYLQTLDFSETDLSAQVNCGF